MSTKLKCLVDYMRLHFITWNNLARNQILKNLSNWMIDLLVKMGRTKGHKILT